MLSLLILGYCAICFAIPDHSQYAGHQVHRVTPQHNEHLHVLREMSENALPGVDFWLKPRAIGYPVDVQVSKEQSQTFHHFLATHNMPYKTIIDDVERSITSHLLTLSKSKNATSKYIWDDYLEYDEMLAWIDTRGGECGSRCEVSSLGSSYEGNDQKLIKITNGNGSAKDGFWIDAGIHAREWIAPAVATYFIDRLIDDYATDTDVTVMLDNFDFYILALMNPDGYIYSHSDDRLWRKSRRPNDDVDSGCFGTDINRNFDHQWGTVGVSDNPCSNTYCGPNAYSEIEAANVAQYIEGASNAWRVFYTLHSYGQLWMAPWGYTTDPPENYDELIRAGQIAADALEAVHGTQYEVGSASEILYSSSGTSRDWAYGVPQIEYVYTIELRDEGQFGFLLPPAQIQPTVEETWAGIKAFTLAILQ